MSSLARRMMRKVFPRTAPDATGRRRKSTLRVEPLEAREVPSAAPDFYWKLDEAGGPNGAVADSAAAAAAPATASNFDAASGPSTEVPVLPYADPRSRRFDGSDDKVVTNAPVNLDGVSLTIAAWVRVTAFSPAAHNISSVAGIEEFDGATLKQTALLRIGDITLGKQKPQFVLDIGDAQVKLDGATELQTGYWYHLAATYDGERMRLYVNGRLDAERAGLTGPVKANGPFYMGSSSLGADRTLNGHLDEVKVFKKTLSAAEVAEVVTEVSPTVAGRRSGR